MSSFNFYSSFNVSKYSDFFVELNPTSKWVMRMFFIQFMVQMIFCIFIFYKFYENNILYDSLKNLVTMMNFYWLFTYIFLNMFSTLFLCLWVLYINLIIIKTKSLLEKVFSDPFSSLYVMNKWERSDKMKMWKRIIMTMLIPINLLIMKFSLPTVVNKILTLWDLAVNFVIKMMNQINSFSELNFILYLFSMLLLWVLLTFLFIKMWRSDDEFEVLNNTPTKKVIHTVKLSKIIILMFSLITGVILLMEMFLYSDILQLNLEIISLCPMINFNFIIKSLYNSLFYFLKMIVEIFILFWFYVVLTSLMMLNTILRKMYWMSKDMKFLWIFIILLSIVILNSPPY